ncbi:MAG: hypothetical protein HDR22_07315 [Lachnospiraceae bacterium]|nr:hypothetical protein [Lachnospiraceae bacterium]
MKNIMRLFAVFIVLLQLINISPSLIYANELLKEEQQETIIYKKYMYICIERFPKQRTAFRYTVGEGMVYGSLLDLGKVASTYAPSFGALVLLRLCRAKACP